MDRFIFLSLNSHIVMQIAPDELIWNYGIEVSCQTTHQF